MNQGLSIPDKIRVLPRCILQPAYI